MTDCQAGAQTRASVFSSGPCAKPPGWDSPEKLATESLGRSHRAKIGKTRLQLLHRPDARSAAAARYAPHRHRARFGHRRLRNGDVDDARARGVTTLAWESFGEGWVTDAAKQLKLDPTSFAPIMASFPIFRRSTGRTMCSSPGTAPPRACAFPMATGSPPTARA
jgi:hypothetical protein